MTVFLVFQDHYESRDVMAVFETAAAAYRYRAILVERRYGDSPDWVYVEEWTVQV